MAVEEVALVNERLLPSGDESGAPPGDRTFRPDVEGLRALAVALVVLYHAGVPGVRGGFVGVDVFFVISGFVITGLLLRERAATGRTSVLSFYARRCRRILPAATVVILATAAAGYTVLGVVSGNVTADDARWAAVFLANFHFASVGTNYLTAQRPPSPLQHYWSLSVEEQFYLVYPTLFLLVARVRTRISLRARLAVGLAVVIVASYTASIVQTASAPTTAYFSPFTRAWELALGALVAVGATWLRRIPHAAAAVATWCGLTAIACSAVVITEHSAYPGSLVAVPVVGTALVIAGGVAASGMGAERLLGRRSWQWLGKRSYSLYLWHWPILVIAAEHLGRTKLPLPQSVLAVAGALLLSMVSYRLVENPIRHWRLPVRRSVMGGAGVVAGTLATVSLVMTSVAASASAPTGMPASNAQVVLDQVARAPRIAAVPKAIADAGYGSIYVEGGDYQSHTCQANARESSVPICALGDTSSRRLMVVYGDSRALMWIPAMERIATASHLKLVVLGKYGCPSVPVSVAADTTRGMPPGTDVHCDQWHVWATRWIVEHRPALVVFSERDNYRAPAAMGAPEAPFTPKQWRRGLRDLFSSFTRSGARLVLLGTTPQLAQPGPMCLAQHPADVQACSTPARLAVPPLGSVDRSAALAHHVDYVATVPWFCSRVCTAIVGDYEVYDTSGVHVSGVWAQYLEGVLAKALGLAVPPAAPITYEPR